MTALQTDLFAPAAAPLRESLLGFADFGAPTQALEDGGIPYLVNEYWTAGQRQAHALHEISYRACFKPQLPAFFIERLTAPGEAVYDPFMGRGTTPLQAALMGRRALGNDANPLSAMLARPRFAPPTLGAVAARLAIVDWADDGVEAPELEAFYAPATLRKLSALRRWLLRSPDLDAVDDWIRMVALNRLTGHSPGFFSVYTLPPNQAASLKAQVKINAKRGQAPPERDVGALILRKSKALLRDGAPLCEPPLLFSRPAEATPDIPDASVDLVVTSPPFLDVVDYAGDNWLRNWFAGLDGAPISTSRLAKPADWQAMARRTLQELARVTRSGGHVAFEVGEVRGGKLALERLVWGAAENLPFQRLFVMVNQQEFTKTANCWGVGNNAKGTNTNRIVMLKRD